MRACSARPRPATSRVNAKRAVRRDRRKRRMTESDARPARFSVLSPRVPSDVRVTYYIYIYGRAWFMGSCRLKHKAGYVYTAIKSIIYRINISYLAHTARPHRFLHVGGLFPREVYVYSESLGRSPWREHPFFWHVGAEAAIRTAHAARIVALIVCAARRPVGVGQALGRRRGRGAWSGS